ncbi:MAG: M20/M25/M40 family metallo-hydrolase [Candidatus Bathyarchaeota archaeon]|nr:MAG: M20/M25/M40 family metallo-hydrolase [Candidatus Bathyarchaeota archaeon]
MGIKTVYDYVDGHSADFIQDLVRLVKQPSISARGEGIIACAEIVEAMLGDVGFSTKLISTSDEYPVVFGELKSKTGKKTILFYDHYDVQPPEPIEEWKFGAFSGEIHEGIIYGRGVSDNKGNIVSRVKAVESFLKTHGDVPVNVKFVVEGEEEVGSPHLLPMVKNNRSLIANDATIWEFGGTNFEGRPEIYLGLKGVLSVELRTQGATRDVHSANAPLVPNPAWRLIWALNSIKDDQDKVLIDDFYENVKEPSETELRLLVEIPLEEGKIKQALGLKEFLHGKRGNEAKKSLLFSPTCTINGFLTGYVGNGSKTVLPRKAMAKLDFRLVPDQRSSEIFNKLVSHMHQRGFADIEAVQHGSTEPTRTPVTHKFVQIVAEAAEKVYEKKTIIYPTSAASGPMHLFRNLLDSPVVSAGCSHADAKGHAPNENLTIDSFIKGTKFMATILNDFGEN